MIGSLAVAVGLPAVPTIVPGPDMAVVARAALVGGRRSAGQTAVGVVCGLLVWGLLAVGGLAAVLAASGEAYAAVRIVGAGYLIWLGLRMLWQSAPRRGHPARRPSGRGPAGARRASRRPCRRASRRPCR
jgi:threonine/homoserine/homoserine lactone efflux protein